MMSYLDLMVKRGFVINIVKNIKFLNVIVMNQEGAVFEFNNCENVEFYRCRVKDIVDYVKILSLNNIQNVVVEQKKKEVGVREEIGDFFFNF